MATIKPLTVVLVGAGVAGAGYLYLQQSGQLAELKAKLSLGLPSSGGGTTFISQPMDMGFLSSLFSNLSAQSSKVNINPVPNLQGAFDNLFGGVTNFVNEAKKGMGDALDKAKEDIKKVSDNIDAKIKAVGDIPKDMFDGVKSALPSASTNFGDKVGSWIGNQIGGFVIGIPKGLYDFGFKTGENLADKTFNSVVSPVIDMVKGSGSSGRASISKSSSFGVASSNKPIPSLLDSVLSSSNKVTPKVTSSIQTSSVKIPSILESIAPMPSSAVQYPTFLRLKS